MGKAIRDARALAEGQGLRIEHRAVGALIPYARNARTHSEPQVAQIAGSIREFGFTNPVLVDGENGIIAGHGRVMAARTLGLATVPVIELGHLTEAQKKAYILADNRLAAQAGWDQALLALELGDLNDRTCPQSVLADFRLFANGLPLTVTARRGRCDITTSSAG